MSYREIFSERFSSLRIKSGISRSQMGKILGVAYPSNLGVVLY